MKIMVIAANGGPGGAGTAARRIYEALQDTCPPGSAVKFVVSSKGSDAPEADSYILYEPSKFQSRFSGLMRKTLWKHIGPVSTGVFSGGLGELINRESPDIVNLHWLGDLSLSLREIRNIKVPVVWTLHDLWPLSGVFHFPVVDPVGRRRRFLLASLNSVDTVFSFCKRFYLRNRISFVAPSQWMAGEVSRRWGSGAEQHEIPYFLPTRFWSTSHNSRIKQELEIEPKQPVILFAAHSLSDPRKGLELLLLALRVVKTLRSVQETNLSAEPVLVLAGAGRVPEIDPLTRVVREPFVSEERLRALYSISTMVVVPSLLDNLPQVATQAQSCGVPVVGFADTGLSSAVRHMETGILVDQATPEALAAAIWDLLQDFSLARRLGNRAAERARANWSSQSVGGAYWGLFHDLSLRRQEKS